MGEEYKWKWEPETEHDRMFFGKDLPVVSKAEALKVIEWWRTAVLCNKPRGSCLKCTVKNCYYKSKSPVLS